MNADQLSGMILRIEELYELADKHLSESKQTMITKEIENMNYDYALNKVKALKQWTISGQKFDTATVFRFLGVKILDKQEKPSGCSLCDDGYIMATNNDIVYAYACSCDLGRLRHKSENMSFYKGQQKTENHKIQTGLIDIDVDIEMIKKRIMKKYAAAISSYESEVECPF